MRTKILMMRNKDKKPERNKAASDLLVYLAGIILYPIGMLSISFFNSGRALVIVSLILVVISILLQIKQQDPAGEIITRIIHLIIFAVLFWVVLSFISIVQIAISNNS